MLIWDDDVFRHQPNLEDDFFVTHGNDSNFNQCYAPGKLVSGFLEIEDINGDPQYYASVRCCSYSYKKSSVFTTRWQLAFENEEKQEGPIFEVVLCDAIVRHCLMIPTKLMNEKQCTLYEEIWPRELWGQEF